MTNREQRLESALKVFTTDWCMSKVLKAVDPKAFEQAENALRNSIEYTMQATAPLPKADLHVPIAEVEKAAPETAPSTCSPRTNVEVLVHKGLATKTIWLPTVYDDGPAFTTYRVGDIIRGGVARGWTLIAFCEPCACQAKSEAKDVFNPDSRCGAYFEAFPPGCVLPKNHAGLHKDCVIPDLLPKNHEGLLKDG